ncbi:MAG: hypothetical protein PVJ02_09775 [Gemmatimonadota bacterium]
MRFPRPTRRFAAIALVVTLLWSGARSVSGQAAEGSTASAVGLAVLGAYSGTVMGLIGAVGPCNRLLSGAVCPRVGAALGGAVGLASGAVLGSNDSAALEGAFRNAGYGALAGGLVGWGLTGVVRQYWWPDPLAIGAVGAAIGASPKGAGAGFVAGAAAGFLSWMAIPRVSVGDAISLALTGLAAGGLIGWVSEAAASRSGGPALATSAALSVSFRLPLP